MRTSEELQDLLEEILAKHRVPGVVAGIYDRGNLTTAATGTSNLNTGVPMTAETGFLAGSTTKVWIASLVMTFVEEGVCDLDIPLISYVPSLRFADPNATRTLTLRHMLTHTSGLDAGDYFVETGELPGATARYMDLLRDCGQIYEPGRWWSYCNGGYVVIAHILEQLTGTDFQTLLHERIIEPLGLARTVGSTDEAILHRTAVGSFPDATASTGHVATPKFYMVRSMAAAGATLITTVDDALDFLRVHLFEGNSGHGKRLLTKESLRLMATRQTDHPLGPATGDGLGWRHNAANGKTVLSHGGGSNGGLANIAIVPEANWAFVAYVNSSTGGRLMAELRRRLLAGVLPSTKSAEPSAATAPPVRVDLNRFVGTYRRRGFRQVVRKDGDKLVVEIQVIPGEAEGVDLYTRGWRMTQTVEPLSETALAGEQGTFHFLEPEDGGYWLMFWSGRIARRETQDT